MDPRGYCVVWPPKSGSSDRWTRGAGVAPSWDREISRDEGRCHLLFDVGRRDSGRTGFGRRGRPCAKGLQHVSVEAVDATGARVDERATSTTSLGPQRVGRSEPEGPDLLARVENEGRGVLTDRGQELCRLRTAGVSDEGLHARGVWRLLELTHQPVHAGRRTALARCIDVDMAGHLAGAQIRSDDKAARPCSGSGWRQTADRWSTRTGSAPVRERMDRQLPCGTALERPQCPAGGRAAGLRIEGARRTWPPPRRCPCRWGGGSRCDLVPDADPRLAHVVELQGAGLAVLEVPDQLTQGSMPARDLRRRGTPSA